MTAIETDYLIIGSGAVGLAFADTMLDESDYTIAIVDRHGKPGGHWNDAYSFVSLHQPSAFYGVNGMQLGSGKKDDHGLNKGLFELASGPEVSGYFDAVMRQKLLPTGRVQYFPMSEYHWDESFTSLLSGKKTEVKVKRKIVDSTYFGTTVPSTHTPKFDIAEDVRFATPNDLPHLWKKPDQVPNNFCIVGAGKTAMDVGVWLISSGADPENIHWVMPRDSWLLNRAATQPSPEFFEQVIGGQAALMEAYAQSTSSTEVFRRMEEAGVMLRIYPDHEPEMFHYATISVGEVEMLQQITNVIRKGRVQSIEQGKLILDGGEVDLPADTLFIDCSACAVEKRPPIPMFQDRLITPQMARIPQPAFSAALVAFVELNYESDAEKNRLCGSIPLPDTLDAYLESSLRGMQNQFQWMQDEKLNSWIRESRLDGFGKITEGVERGNATHQAIIKRLRDNSMPAMFNLQKLIEQNKAAA